MSLSTETAAKGEALRQKKKLKADMNELAIALEHANGSNMEAQATIKKYHHQVDNDQHPQPLNSHILHSHPLYLPFIR